MEGQEEQQPVIDIRNLPMPWGEQPLPPIQWDDQPQPKVWDLPPPILQNWPAADDEVATTTTTTTTITMPSSEEATETPKSKGTKRKREASHACPTCGKTYVNQGKPYQNHVQACKETGREKKRKQWATMTDVDELRRLLLETEQELWELKQGKSSAQTSDLVGSVGGADAGTPTKEDKSMRNTILKAIRQDLKNGIQYKSGKKGGTVGTQTPNVSPELLGLLFGPESLSDWTPGKPFHYALTVEKCQEVLGVQPSYFAKSLRYGNCLTPDWPISFTWNPKTRILKSGLSFSMM